MSDKEPTTAFEREIPNLVDFLLDFEDGNRETINQSVQHNGSQYCIITRAKAGIWTLELVQKSQDPSQKRWPIVRIWKAKYSTRFNFFFQGRYLSTSEFIVEIKKL